MPVYRICLRCKQPMTPWENRVCPTCREAYPPGKASNPNYMRDYWRKRRNDPELRTRERDRLRKANHAKPIEERRRYCRDRNQFWRSHPENKEKLKARERRISEEVIAHYGGHCACCGEDRYEFMAIDHPNNDGAEHRRKIRTSFRPWLKRKGFPEGFRVLCHNCNTARFRYGICPHERERSESHAAATNA